MDTSVFANKSFTYKIKDIELTLICDANYNNDFYFTLILLSNILLFLKFMFFIYKFIF